VTAPRGPGFGIGQERYAPAIADAVLPLEPRPRSASLARRFTADTLGRWGAAELSETAVLLVSELVTNAVLHARSASELVVRMVDNGIRVEVRDDDPVTPSLRTYSLEAGTGRGLLLVESLAARWGSSPDGFGKSVWFELDHGATV
jgi:hypothetical protein